MVNNEKVTTFANAVKSLVDDKEDLSNKTTSLSSSSTNVQYPSAKAVYDALAEVTASSGGNYIYDFYLDSSTDDIVLEYDSASGGGSGGSGGSVTVDSSWVTNSTNPVESQLIKSALDSKSDTSHTHSQYLTEHQSLANYVTTLDSRLSDARTPTAHTHTTTDITNLSIPNASSTTPSADTENGSVGTGTTWARSNHTHPKSSLYAEASHTHSNYVNPTIADNLTTNDSNQVLSAKQGKILNDLIGQAISYINQ